MRKNDIILGIVFLVAVIGAGLLAQVLHGKQMKLAQSRQYVSKMPIAGFQKFMADVIWMRFLYFAGGTQLDEDSVEKYDQYIHLIIKLDPDFFRAYRDGALMLGPIAPEKALKIIDMAEERPGIRDRWELPMMGGQIIMRKQWQGHYAGKEMDLKEVARAQQYFQRAKGLSGARPTALSSFIRSKALIAGKENDLPRELNELQIWREYWQRTRMEFDFEGMGSSDSEMGMSDAYYGSVDLESRILNHVKKVAKRHIQDPEAKDKVRDAARELVKNTIAEVFPGRHFDAESYIPYNAAAMRRYQDVLADIEADKDYIIELDAPDDFAINVLTIQAVTGEATVTVLINDQPVKGLDNIEVKQVKVTTPGLVPVEPPEEEKTKADPSKRVVPAAETVDAPPGMVRLPLENNKGRAGNTIKLKFSNVKSNTDVAFVLSVYDGDYF